MTAILFRLVKAQNQRIQAAEDKKDAEDRYADADKRWNASRVAFAAFGFDVMSGGVLWDQVREALGDDIWQDTFNRAALRRPNTVTIPSPPPPPPRSDIEVHEPPPMPAIREVVLSQLALAGDAGLKAADLREHILQAYGRTVHDKTVGMTLYRLSKAGHARREGFTWFTATPEGETENPGGDTPGSEDGQHGNGGA